LMTNRDLQQKTGGAGVKYVRAFHSWTSIASQLVKIYQQIIDRKRLP
jgi:hypothetical protein